MADVLRTAFAGSFFPGDPRELAEMVDGFLNCGAEPHGNAAGMVVPHAGYIYSGKTAGYGFASAPDGVSTVVVCAPSHRYPLMEAAVFDIQGVQTPLGVCPVNGEAAGELARSLDTVVFNEHSFEVMVPFIQRRWPDAEIVPVILGMSPDCPEIARLIEAAAPGSFFVASSDLSHFHPLSAARELDRMAIEGFLSLSPEVFRRALQSGGEACGRYPILTLLHLAALRKATRALELHYSTSADAGAGTDEVVGYFSGLVTG